MKAITEKEFKEWLQKKDQYTRVTIAARAALRVFPLATAYEKKSSDQELLALRTGRAILAAVVVATKPSIQTNASALSALFITNYSAHIAGSKAAESALDGSDSSIAESAVQQSAQASYGAGGSYAAFKLEYGAAESEGNASFTETHLLKATYTDTDLPINSLMENPLWHSKGALGFLPDVLVGYNSHLDTNPEWSFWREWYQGFLDGEPMDWDLQRAVALIPDANWDKGPEHIAGVIEGIRRDFDRKAEESAKPPEPTREEKQAVAARVKFNREALALSIAGVLEQIDQFREEVRGRNDLEPEYREDLMAFLDRLSKELDSLLHNLPEQGTEVSDEKAEELVHWYKRFLSLATKEAKEYVSPENAAKAVVPSGIILVSTGIGSLVGGPPGAGVGALVGGLIVGHVKPGKAVDELMKPSDPPVDGG